MIVTVTANAAIDRTIRVDRLVPGRLHHAREDYAQAGGKGVNVARLLHAMGVPVHAIVVVAGASGDFICADLTRAGISYTRVGAEGASRTCLEIVDESSGIVTQVHGDGVRGTPALADALLEAVLQRGTGAAWVAICGSMPRGFPAESLDAIADGVRMCGARLAIDTSGEALARFVRRDPDLVRVNRVELVEAMTLDAPRSAGHSLGVGWPGGKVPELALVSDASSPVRVWSRASGRALVTPPAVAVSNPIGCGDAMLAGLLAQLVRGGTQESAIAYGIAVGAAQAEARVPGQLDLARANELEHLVSTVRWSSGH